MEQYRVTIRPNNHHYWKWEYIIESHIDPDPRWYERKRNETHTRWGAKRKARAWVRQWRAFESNQSRTVTIPL